MPLKLTNTNAAYNGHTVPFADLRSGRAYGGHAVPFRAYGGHAVPFAPTAFPTKANCKEFAFCFIWEGPTEASKNLHKGNHRSPTTCEK